MSNTFYVNASANNGRITNDKNNRYSYDLPAPLPLETGTQITAVSSFVNLQGVNGASIEIPEEVVETIVFQYYINDTSHFMPTEDLKNNGNTNTWATLKETSTSFHATAKFGTNPVDDLNPLPAGWEYGQGIFENTKNETGYSEMIMPLVRPSAYDPNGVLIDSKNYFVPFVGQVEIKIPAGTYSISKISELISNQINQIEIPNTPNNNFVENQLTTPDSQYNGFYTNNTTCRNMGYKGTEAEWQTYVDSGGASFPGEWSAYFPDNTGPNGFPVRVLTNTDYQPEGFSAIAVHTKKSADIRKLTVAGYIGEAQAPARIVCENLMSKAKAGGVHNDFFRCLNIPTTTTSYNNYNIFSRGMGVGSTGIKLDYNTVKSGFSVSRLHNPRTIPTYDMFGNSMSNAGQESIFIKRQCGQNDVFRRQEIPDRTGAGGQIARPLKQAWTQFLSIPMTRTTGILILNWGLQTCKKLGSNPDLAPDTNTPELAGGYAPNRANDFNTNNLDEYKTYREWFSSDLDAKNAWETTIWYRLGFTYDDIQNPNKFEKVFNPNPANGDEMEFTVIDGFTTDQSIDSSILPTISTIFNAQGASESDTPYRPDKEAINPVNGSISGIQMFNTMDINAPIDILNNNTKFEAQIGNCVGAYKGSFYSGAVMRPVITTPKEIVANRLPILSNNGYLLITSDLVENEDITKSGTYIGVLDVVPKSSLSNQDFMSDRNALTHTLSNPKVINSINIAILNPDMTDIELEPNSNVLLQITYPQQKQTISLASEQLAMEQNAMINSVKGIQADSLGLNPSLLNFESSTIPVNNKLAVENEIQEAQENLRMEILLRDPEDIFDPLGDEGLRARQAERERRIRERAEEEGQTEVEPPRVETERTQPSRKKREEIVAEPKPDIEPAVSKEPPPPQRREQEARIIRAKTIALQKKLDNLKADKAKVVEGGKLKFSRASPEEKEKEREIANYNAQIDKIRKELSSFRTPTGERYKADIVGKPRGIVETQLNIRRRLQREQGLAGLPPLTERVLQEARETSTAPKRERRAGGGPAPQQAEAPIRRPEE